MNPLPPAIRPRRPSLRTVLPVTVVLLAAGCGGPDGVSGKVTVRGQPVTAGMVTFLGADNKEAVGTINADGTYRITAPPRGEVRVTVKALPGLGGRGGGVPAPSSLVRPPKNAPPMPPHSVPAGPKVPAKYANPANGLKFNVTGGPQTFDIDLAP